MINQITCASCGKIVSHFYTIWRKNTKNVRGKNTWKKRDGKLVCSDCLVKYLDEYDVIHEWNSNERMTKVSVSFCRDIRTPDGKALPRDGLYGLFFIDGNPVHVQALVQALTVEELRLLSKTIHKTIQERR